MSSCRLGRRPLDLLHEVADLHAYVERELHGVAVAVSDLDDFFFAAIESSQSSNVNTRESGQAAAAAARALAGRRLHSILSRGRQRILSALARQRILLWEFSEMGNPTTDAEATTTASATAAAAAAGEGEKQRDKKERTASTRRLQVEPHHQQQPNGAAAGDDHDDDDDDHDDDWKRHTLVGMHRLLSRKASEQTVTAAARATLVRDMTKIAAALERLGIQTTAAAAAAPLLADDVQPPPSSTPTPTPSSPQADNLRCGDPATIPSGGATKGVSFDNAMAMANDVVDVPTITLRREGEGSRCVGGTSFSSSCSERGARQSEKGVGGSDSNSHPLGNSSSSSSSSSNVLLRQQLQLPDGIDLLLRRISEGVRSPNRKPPAPPAALPATISDRLRPGNSSRASAAKVAMPPSVLSENTGAETRQGSTSCGLSARGCGSLHLDVDVGVACDENDERETRCRSQDIVRGVAGCGEGCGDGRGGIGGTEERRTTSSPIGLLGACCLSAEGEVIRQRRGKVGRVKGTEAVGGGDGKDGSPNALIVSVNRGSKPGLSCSSVVAFASPTKGCPRSGPLGGGDDKENRRV